MVRNGESPTGLLLPQKVQMAVNKERCNQLWQNNCPMQGDGARLSQAVLGSLHDNNKYNNCQLFSDSCICKRARVGDAGIKFCKND